jgi:hypothetical protein|tara:strand:- start:120 stop:341 length:222 start_codon:yes stop_codon:yes gene_type:complete
MKRNYRQEYLTYGSTTKAKKDRASRNKVRRMLTRQGRVSKGDGRDIDHRDGNPRNNSNKNLRVISKSRNRAKK